MQLTEQLSALYDGELDPVEQMVLIEEVLADQELQQQLTKFQLVREVLKAHYALSANACPESLFELT